MVGYRIYYQAEGSQDNPTTPSSVDIGASATQHTLSGLQGGIWYTITVVTKSQYLPSTVVGPVRVTLRKDTDLHVTVFVFSVQCCTECCQQQVGE